MKSKLITVIFFLLGSALTTAQLAAQTLPRLNFEVKMGGNALKMPLIGGLNLPQFSEIDLNGDGKQDLFVFDRAGNVRLTFLNVGNAGQTNYQFAPQYLADFPDLNDWALMRDYNGDGIADLFGLNDGVPQGIRVYKGARTAGKYTFERVNFAFSGNVLNYTLSNGLKTNVYVNNVDIPAIDDIDGDGDLDVLAFEVGGGSVYFYQNYSVERRFGRDSFFFDLADRCWGRFFDNGFQSSVKLGSRDTCATSFRNGGGVVQQRHPGATITTFDLDGDGDKDALLGSISFNNLTGLFNGGNRNAAWVNVQDNDYPSNTEGVSVTVFPGSYLVDVNNDGKKDLLASPSALNFVENYNSSWLYLNNGTATVPSFQLQQKDFLIRDMVDLGSIANPAFCDVDGDGLKDLIVGNLSYYRNNNVRDSRLFLFKNTGTAASPKFELTNDNWLNFKELANIDVNNFSPAFGDMDNDGDVDLIVGEDSGTLFYIRNDGGAGRPLSMAAAIPNWLGLSVGASCKPTIVDLNRDGLPDLVVGRRNGSLDYYQNIGSRTNPNFGTTPTRAFLGNVDVRDFGFQTGFATPQFVDFNGKYLLFCGSDGGKIWLYDNIDNNLNGNFRLVSNDYGKVREGARTAIAIANINADQKLEMVVGNLRGGFSAYTMSYNLDGTTPVQSIDNQFFVKISPNPVSDFLSINVGNTEGSPAVLLNVYDGAGKRVLSEKKQFAEANFDLNVGNLGSGFYLLEIITEKGRSVAKFVKK